MDTASPDVAERRKRVRKGTRSCLACKRRKVRCIFSYSQTVCLGCLSRGTACASQLYARDLGDDESERRQSMQTGNSLQMAERVARLEMLVKTMAKESESASIAAEKGLADLPGSKEEHTALDVFNPDVLRPELHPRAPILELFDNHRVDTDQKDAPGKIAYYASRQEDTSISKRTSENSAVGRLSAKTSSVRRALLALLPAQSTLEKIVVRYRESLGLLFTQTLAENPEWLCTVHSVESLSQSHPTAIAVYLLCFCLGVQQLPQNFDNSQLSLSDQSPREFSWRVVNTVSDHITSDDDFVGTLEGLRCLILQAKYFINMGKPRRAGLSIRRALNLSEMMGLHRVASKQSRLNDKVLLFKIYTLWRHILVADRMTSMLLGTPYGISNSHCGLKPDLEQSYLAPDEFLYQVAIISGEILDRNHSQSLGDYGITQSIDQKLEKLGANQAESWWYKATNPDILNLSDKEIYYRISTQFAYYNVIIFLHLPFMSQPDTVRRFDYSKSACLAACRSTLDLFIALDQLNRIHHPMCRVINFHGFLAVLILLLELIKPSRHGQSNELRHLESRIRRNDWEYVSKLTSIFEEHSKTARDSLSEQALKVIRTLTEKKRDQGGIVQLPIPYFGTITISQDYMTSNMADPGTDSTLKSKRSTSSTSTYESEPENFSMVLDSAGGDFSIQQMQDQNTGYYSQSQDFNSDRGIGREFDAFEGESLFASWSHGFSVGDFVDINDNWNDILEAPDVYKGFQC